MSELEMPTEWTNDPKDVERIALRKLKLSISECLNTDGLALEVNPEVVLDVATKCLTMRLSMQLSSNRIWREITKCRHVPVTWWDAFKLRWFPKWALRRWPAREETIEEWVEFTHVCPHLPLNQSHSGKLEHLLFLKPSRY